MKALTLNGYDGLASLRFAEVATPEPGPNDVLVKMKAASVNPVYVTLRVSFDEALRRAQGDPTRGHPHCLDQWRPTGDPQPRGRQSPL